VPCSPFPQSVTETEGGRNRHGHFKEISLASVANRILSSLHSSKMKCAIRWFTITPWFYLGPLNMSPIAFPIYPQLSHPLRLGTWLVNRGYFHLGCSNEVLTPSPTSSDVSKSPPEIMLIRKHLTDTNLAASLPVA